MRLPDFNPEWNHHYDYNDPANLAEIMRVRAYDIAADSDVYVAGRSIESPWGDNRVIASSRTDGQDVCIKEITVLPGRMLSLQRHRGRNERWQVKAGTLTFIIATERFSMGEGGTVNLPPGTVHCMANLHGAPVTIVETQTGINREADNIRLMDVNGRGIYPLTTQEEHNAAHLYARLAEDLVARTRKAAG